MGNMGGDARGTDSGLGDFSGPQAGEAPPSAGGQCMVQGFLRGSPGTTAFRSGLSCRARGKPLLTAQATGHRPLPFPVREAELRGLLGASGGPGPRDPILQDSLRSTWPMPRPAPFRSLPGLTTKQPWSLSLPLSTSAPSSRQAACPAAPRVPIPACLLCGPGGECGATVAAQAWRQLPRGSPHTISRVDPPYKGEEGGGRRQRQRAEEGPAEREVPWSSSVRSRLWPKECGRSQKLERPGWVFPWGPQEEPAPLAP